MLVTLDSRKTQQHPLAAQRFSEIEERECCDEGRKVRPATKVKYPSARTKERGKEDTLTSSCGLLEQKEGAATSVVASSTFSTLQLLVWVVEFRKKFRDRIYISQLQTQKRRDT
jgi:hypothetical protein